MRTPDGLRWGVETGELAHLLPLDAFLLPSRATRARLVTEVRTSRLDDWARSDLVPQQLG